MVYPISCRAGFVCPKAKSQLFSGRQTLPYGAKRQHYPRFDPNFLSVYKSCFSLILRARLIFALISSPRRLRATMVTFLIQLKQLAGIEFTPYSFAPALFQPLQIRHLRPCDIKSSDSFFPFIQIVIQRNAHDTEALILEFLVSGNYIRHFFATKVRHQLGPEINQCIFVLAYEIG